MKRLIFMSVILISILLMGSRTYSQSFTAEEQNKKLGRGVNIIGYDNAFWKTIPMAGSRKVILR